ncbi:MAG: hypothetical protein H3C39_11545 [Flavobacteriia bacterium]|nr:hypothetical protein [Flavobacteriia bacterium]
MKSKSLLMLLLLLGSFHLNAQFSFKIKTSNPEKIKEAVRDNPELKKVSDSLLEKGKLNWSNLNQAAKDKGISTLDDLKSQTEWFPIFKTLDDKSGYSIRFFEGEDENQRYFQNSNVLYNPKLKSMSLNSEIINDYFGGFRVGVGFQLSSMVKNDNLSDEEVDKNKLISSLQNGGGNIFINIKFPILLMGDDNSKFGLKSNFYHNTGFELTKFNQADDDFMMTNNTGIMIGGFGRGYKDNIYLFAQAKAGLIYGNSKFRNILAADEKVNGIIPITHFELGMNFSDLYTVKVDMYPFGNYIKNNFPSTISFVINLKNNNN